jgi:hypothetical protein
MGKKELLARLFTSHVSLLIKTEKLVANLARETV